MRRYELSAGRKALNGIVRLLLRAGIGPRRTYLMTAPGRSTGRPRTTPVTLVVNPGGRWLVAPYGPVSWVHNVRAAGRVTLRRGRHTEEVTATEVGGPAAAAVLKAYMTEVPITRPYFDVTPDSPLADFEAEAGRHPVFALG